MNAHWIFGQGTLRKIQAATERCQDWSPETVKRCSSDFVEVSNNTILLLTNKAVPLGSLDLREAQAELESALNKTMKTEKSLNLKEQTIVATLFRFIWHKNPSANNGPYGVVALESSEYFNRISKLIPKHLHHSEWTKP